jgi:hypothetical protein
MKYKIAKAKKPVKDSMNRWVKHIVKIELLYDTEISGRPEAVGKMDIDDIHYQTTYGHMSGIVKFGKPKFLTATEMSDELVKQGSDPDFLLGLLSDKWVNTLKESGQ